MHDLRELLMIFAEKNVLGHIYPLNTFAIIFEKEYLLEYLQRD